MVDETAGQPQGIGGLAVEVRRRSPGEARAYVQGVKGGLELALTALRLGFDRSCGDCNGCGCSRGPHEGGCPDGVPRCPACDATGNPALALVERHMDAVRALNPGGLPVGYEHPLRPAVEDFADAGVLIPRFRRLLDPDNGPSTDEERLALMEFMSRSMALLEAVEKEVSDATNGR